MTTAFAALFAACSNEDFLDNVQNVPSNQDAQRPTVDNVILNLVGDGAETRLGFDSEDGYLWEKGDTLGALLMDDWNDALNALNGKRPSTHPDEWPDFTWTQRYVLSDQIHTDYPFIRQDDGTWSCNTKMQEGNYFFAFPFTSYDGKREALHDLSEQVQNGDNVKEAYAKNNFFIGYARIMAGTESADVVSTNLKMTPVLGAVGITVKNVGVEPFTVKKIVLKTPDNVTGGFSTIVKVDPTNAKYVGEDASLGAAHYNINNNLAYWNGSGCYFNYANYEEMNFDGTAWNYNDKFTERYRQDGALVNNTEKSDNYNRDNALRAVINPVANTDHRVELTVNNSRELASTESANFIVMTNIYKYNNRTGAQANTITADIYTDKGMIKDVEISNVKEEVSGGVTVISENPIVEIAPDKVNKVTLEIDNNSVQAPDQMNIFNEEDLVQFIEWNQTMRRPYTATLKNNITLTKEMSDLLTKKDDEGKPVVFSTLIVNNAGKKLTIAKDAADNILDYVLVDGEIVVENALVLGSNSYVNGEYTGLIGTTTPCNITNQKIKIAENASVTVSGAIEYKSTGEQKKKELVISENKGALTINADVNKLTVTENRGTMEVNAVVTIAGQSANKQNATLTIGANGNLACAGILTNQGLATQEEYAVIYNNGKIYNLVNAAYGKVIVGEEKGIVTNVNSNAGIIDISANIEADINKKDQGTIAYTVAKDAAVTMKSIKEAKITELTVDGGSVTSVKTDGVVDATTVNKVIVTENGGAMGIKEIGSTFSNAAFEINGDVTLYNLTIGKNIEVKAGTTTIRGTVNAKNSDITLASYDDKKYVSYDATLNVATSTDTLIAKSIAKVSTNRDKAGEAKVSNQGTVKLANTNVDSKYVTWTGNKQDKQDDVYTDKTVNLIVVYNPGSTATTGNPTNDGQYIIAANAEFKTLNSLVASGYTDKNNKINYKYVVKEVVIESSLSFNNDATNAAQFKTLVAGKKVTLKANLTYCDPAYNISMGDLILEGSEIQIGSGNQNQTRTFLTVNSIDYSMVTTKLTINAGYIQIVGESQVGLSDGVTYNSSISKAGTGKLVITNKIDTNELLEWDFTTNKWKKI